MTITEKLRMMKEMEARNNARLRAAGLLHRTGKLVRQVLRSAADEGGAYWGNVASAAGSECGVTILEAEAYTQKD